MKNKPTPEDAIIAIHRHCLQCSGGNRNEVHRCGIKSCNLWPFRESEREQKPKKDKGQLSVFDLIQEV